MLTEETTSTIIGISVVQPKASVPVQVYIIPELGEEVTVDPELAFNHMFGFHEYEEKPGDAIKVISSPSHTSYVRGLLFTGRLVDVMFIEGADGSVIVSR